MGAVCNCFPFSLLFGPGQLKVSLSLSTITPISLPRPSGHSCVCAHNWRHSSPTLLSSLVWASAVLIFEGPVCFVLFLFFRCALPPRNYLLRLPPPLFFSELRLALALSILLTFSCFGGNGGREIAPPFLPVGLSFVVGPALYLSVSPASSTSMDDFSFGARVGPAFSPLVFLVDPHYSRPPLCPRLLFFLSSPVNLLLRHFPALSPNLDCMPRRSFSPL